MDGRTWIWYGDINIEKRGESVEIEEERTRILLFFSLLDLPSVFLLNCSLCLFIGIPVCVSTDLCLSARA